MIAGIIDAMRSQYPFAVRIVWQCLENRADQARCWNATDAEIATEIGASVATVGRALATLAADRIIRRVRHKRRRTTFHMLRTYPQGCPRPRHEPEVANRIQPELSPQKAESTAELSPQKADSKYPLGIHQKEERGAPASHAPAPPSSPAPAAVVVAGKKGSGIERKNGAARYGERISRHWSPSRDTYDYLAEAGIEAVDRRAEVFHHRHLASDWRQLDWDAAFIADCLGTLLPDAKRRPTLDERIASTHDHYAAMARRMGLFEEARP